MNVSFFISRRLSLASDGHKRSPAVGVGIAAVALAVLVMASAIAIVTGFKHEITSRVAGFNSHMTLTASEAETYDDADSGSSGKSSGQILTLTPTLKAILDSKPYIDDYALQATIPAIFKTQTDFKGAYLKSLSGKNATTFIRDAVTSGEVPDYSLDSCRNLIVISNIIASRLGLMVGDRIDTYFITDRLQVRPLRVAAIYNSHFDSYDDAFAFGSLPLIQELGKLGPNEATAIVVSVKDFPQVDDNTFDLRETFVDEYARGSVYRLYNVSNARQSGAAYFHWLGMLDTNVAVVLTLMTIVAVMTLISGMLILMVDKVRIIALLAALGAPRRMISRVFILLASKIAVIGLLIGDALALGFLYFQKYTHFLPLDPDSYYIDFVPVEISLSAMLILNAGVLAIIMTALILPSRFAGKAAPARTLSRE